MTHPDHDQLLSNLAEHRQRIADTLEQMDQVTRIVRILERRLVLNRQERADLTFQREYYRVLQRVLQNSRAQVARALEALSALPEVITLD